MGKLLVGMDDHKPGVELLGQGQGVISRLIGTLRKISSQDDCLHAVKVAAFSRPEHDAGQPRG